MNHQLFHYVPSSIHAVILALGLAAVGCQSSSTSAAPCDTVSATQACTCPNGAMGQRVCRDDMTFGVCEGCPQPPPESSLEIEYITIGGGSFVMGHEDGPRDGGRVGGPTHEVNLSAFEMSKTEVTVGQYRACMAAGECSEPVCDYCSNDHCDWNEEPTDREDHPVVCVTWGQARTFAEWAGGRLPSEAEWEYAARSRRSDILYPWGTRVPEFRCDTNLLNFNDCLDDTTPVCTYPAGNTAQGLCDMAGNVWEWVEDDWHDSYDGAPNDGTARVDESRSDFRIDRGGSFHTNGLPVRKLRMTRRRDQVPDSAAGVRGFRLARSPR